MDEDKSYCILVKGNIIIKEGFHSCRGLACGDITPDNVVFSSEHHPDEQFLSKRVINGDLILDNKTTLIPYACYVAEGGISSISDETNGYYDPLDASSAWGARQKQIMETFEEHKNDCNPIIMNGIFISLFSSFELSLSDITIQAIIENDKGDVVTQYLNQRKSTSISSEDPWAFVDKLQNKFHFLAFDAFAKLYKTVFNIKIPSTYRLKQLIHKRNNIVHRAALSSFDRMTSTSATTNDIQNLADATTEFIKQLSLAMANIE